jgi:transposase-like protein
MESSRPEVVAAASASGTVVPESKRRRRSIGERRRVVEETLAPGASVARVARAHGINANQVFHWRRLYQRGLLEGKVRRPVGLLPVNVCVQISLNACSAARIGPAMIRTRGIFISHLPPRRKTAHQLY